jgi:hypothetical protein
VTGNLVELHVFFSTRPRVPGGEFAILLGGIYILENEKNQNRGGHFIILASGGNYDESMVIQNIINSKRGHS